MSTKILITGGARFLGQKVCAALAAEGFTEQYVLRKTAYDLTEQADVRRLMAEQKPDVIVHLAAVVGGMGFIEHNKALCMLSVLINTHMLMAGKDAGVRKFFYSTSACVYAAGKQTDPNVTALKEEDAYPAMPEDGYGWEKLFSERMCRHFREDYGLHTRMARYHNVYGPQGTLSLGPLRSRLAR